MKNLLLFLTIVMLTGCNALNFQTKPQIQQDCQYESLTGTEFRLTQLPTEQLPAGFANIYVAQSKNSATLSADYQGMLGKLTNNIIDRNYPNISLFAYRPSLFRHSLFYDDDYDDFYLTANQRMRQQRHSKSIFQQAILQNCEIVYILVDSLAENADNPLLSDLNLQIINNKEIEKL